MLLHLHSILDYVSEGSYIEWESSLIWPISIDIPSNTRARRNGLAILPPKPVIGLSVQETIWIHNWKDVEVIFVDKSLDLRIGAVPRQECICQIFSYLSLKSGSHAQENPQEPTSP